jgi:mycoredoxin
MASIPASIELYGTRSCPYTQEWRESLLWNAVGFVEYDVDEDPGARQRLRALTGGRAAVPVVVEDGRVKEVGWHGLSCIVSAAT